MKTLLRIVSDLSNDFETLAKWFYDNYMILNPFITLDFRDQNYKDTWNYYRQ